MKNILINEMLEEDLMEYNAIIKMLYNNQYELSKDFFTGDWDVFDTRDGYELGLTTESDLINFCLKSKNIELFQSVKMDLEDKMDYLTDYRYSMYK